jgi:hypothetical protein
LPLWPISFVHPVGHRRGPSIDCRRRTIPLITIIPIGGLTSCDGETSGRTSIRRIRARLGRSRNVFVLQGEKPTFCGGETLRYTMRQTATPHRAVRLVRPGGP